MFSCPRKIMDKSCEETGKIEKEQQKRERERGRRERDVKVQLLKTKTKQNKKQKIKTERRNIIDYAASAKSQSASLTPFAADLSQKHQFLS